MSRSRLSLFAALLLVAAHHAASPALAQENWAAFAPPGVHAVMRHANAPGTGDPEGFRLGDCATQRNLDEAGREQARAIGRAIEAAGVAVTRVMTSQWCRSAETARLLDLGPVVEEPALNSFFEDRTDEPAQTERLRALLAAGADQKLILVTHQVNITALTGIVPASGEVVLVTATADAGVEVVGRVATDAP